MSFKDVLYPFKHMFLRLGHTGNIQKQYDRLHPNPRAEDTQIGGVGSDVCQKERQEKLLQPALSDKIMECVGEKHTLNGAAAVL